MKIIFFDITNNSYINYLISVICSIGKFYSVIRYVFCISDENIRNIPRIHP